MTRDSGIDRQAEAQRVRAGDVVADQALQQRIRALARMRFRPRTVHEPTHVEHARTVAVTNVYTQSATSRVLLDRVDATLTIWSWPLAIARSILP